MRRWKDHGENRRSLSARFGRRGRSIADMIAFAQGHFDPATRPNLRFEVAEARSLPFKHEFDLVVSFNALHWIPKQDAALASIHSALISDGEDSCVWSWQVSQELGVCRGRDTSNIEMECLLPGFSRSLSAPDIS